LPQGQPPGHDLGRQRPLDLVAAPARLDVRLQFLAALDLPSEGYGFAVPRVAPAVEGEGGPEGGGEDGRGEQGGANLHDRSPGCGGKTLCRRADQALGPCKTRPFSSPRCREMTLTGTQTEYRGDARSVRASPGDEEHRPLGRLPFRSLWLAAGLLF